MMLPLFVRWNLSKMQLGCRRRFENTTKPGAVKRLRSRYRYFNELMLTSAGNIEANPSSPILLPVRTSFSNAELGFLDRLKKVIHPAALTDRRVELRSRTFNFVLLARAAANAAAPSSPISFSLRLSSSNEELGFAKHLENATHPVEVIVVLDRSPTRENFLSVLFFAKAFPNAVAPLLSKRLLVRSSSSKLEFGFRSNCASASHHSTPSLSSSKDSFLRLLCLANALTMFAAPSLSNPTKSNLIVRREVLLHLERADTRSRVPLLSMHNLPTSKLRRLWLCSKNGERIVNMSPIRMRQLPIDRCLIDLLQATAL
mmetsp:Transcript_4579/g.10344  ORF Transcript_4579/g.10344 Transcript_4579/m.10344 type:complete len:315 (+) Transcript_4579:589-1533(+)